MGYNTRWVDNLFTKAEETKVAEQLNDNADFIAALSAIGLFIPDSFYKRVGLTAGTFTQLKYRRAAQALRTCSNRGATFTQPWPPIIGFSCPGLDFKIASR